MFKTIKYISAITGKTIAVPQHLISGFEEMNNLTKMMWGIEPEVEATIVSTFVKDLYVLGHIDTLRKEYENDRSVDTP